jgi:hypothetical protein
MMKITVTLGIAICLCIGLSGQTQGAGFSADLVVSSGAAQTSPVIGKLYLSGNQVRIEDPQLPDGVFLVNEDTGSALFYRPGRMLIMDARETSVLTQLLVPVVPEQPCSAWQHMAETAGATQQGGTWRCRKLERAAVSAPAGVLSYEAISPRNLRHEITIDTARGFPVRIENANGVTVTLDNIRDEVPAAALFEPPAGLRRFDPQQLIDRIKQSDVWIEQPK